MSAATFSTSIEAQQAAVLLEGYRFELGNHDARQWVSLWLETYRPAWIRDAVIEALYQGRYKSISVRQILELWTRRGQPIRHVTHEFEAAVCREFGEVKLAAGTKLAGRSQNAGTSSIRHPNAATTTYQPARAAASSEAHSLRNTHSHTGPMAAVSFDLSATPPGMASVTSPETAASEPVAAAHPTRKLEDNESHSVSHSSEPYRRVSRSAIQSPAETEALLRTQRQLNGVLYSSARAIQPFKPALPFSAQTLRLARQKALA